MLYAGRTVRERPALLDGAPQAAYFVVGIRAAGPGAGPMAGFDAAGVREEFLDGGRTPPMVVTIGRPGPDARRPRLPRLDVGEVVTTV